MLFSEGPCLRTLSRANEYNGRHFKSHGFPESPKVEDSLKQPSRDEPLLISVIRPPVETSCPKPTQLM